VLTITISELPLVKATETNSSAPVKPIALNGLGVSLDCSNSLAKVLLIFPSLVKSAK